jgi:hypothetical protein
MSRTSRLGVTDVKVIAVEVEVMGHTLLVSLA